MSLFAWILLGLVCGLFASKVVNHGGADSVFDVAVGVAGAVVGGFLCDPLGATEVTELKALFVAFVGAFVALVVKHAVTDRDRVSV